MRTIDTARVHLCRDGRIAGAIGGNRYPVLRIVWTIAPRNHDKIVGGVTRPGRGEPDVDAEGSGSSHYLRSRIQNAHLVVPNGNAGEGVGSRRRTDA